MLGKSYSKFCFRPKNDSPVSCYPTDPNSLGPTQLFFMPLVKLMSSFRLFKDFFFTFSIQKVLFIKKKFQIAYLPTLT